MGSLLAGRKALIVGSTSGMGLEIARMFGSEGAVVVINGRSQDRAVSARSQLQSLGVNCGISIGDVRNDEDVREVIRGAVEYLRGLDALVISGSSTSSPPANFFMNTDPAQYDDWARVHWLSKMSCTYHAVPAFQKSGRGSIVYISTDAGRFPTVGESFACGAAAALHMMTRTISLELKRFGVRVNAVSTTVMRGTPGMDVDLGDAAKVFEKVLRKQTLPLQPVDVAHAALYLTSDWARSVTGQIVSVNGGVSTGL